MKDFDSKIVILGGGAAGFFSAIHNKKNNPNSTVVMIEKSGQVLSKVKISGGGRCNVTHACFEPKLLSENYPRGGRELLGPYHVFQSKDTIAWFEAHGVALKIESDNRVFPVSDQSQEIIDCLVRVATGLGIKIWTHAQVTDILKKDPNFCLSLADGQVLMCQKLVLATGSNPQGYVWAKQFGHTIEAPVPSLFTFRVDDPALHALSGLAVDFAQVWIAGEKKKGQKGPVLMTHWGMSGPGIIKLSAWNARSLFEAGYRTALYVNWLPHVDIDVLKERVAEFQGNHPKKGVGSQSPFFEIPTRLWAYLIEKTKVSAQTLWKQINSKQIDRLVQELSEGVFAIAGKGTFKEEFVTCGGVSLKEVNFKTMESKVCPGLYIIGELLDIDGVTGGFNFQNAWTTGFLSGSG